MRGRRLLLVIAASAALLLGVSPAHAYSGPIYHGSDTGWVYWVDDDHITVCDNESDGHGVWVDYYTSGGGLRTMVDGNGSADFVLQVYVNDFQTLTASTSSGPIR